MKRLMLILGGMLLFPYQLFSTVHLIFSPQFKDTLNRILIKGGKVHPLTIIDNLKTTIASNPDFYYDPKALSSQRYGSQLVYDIQDKIKMSADEWLGQDKINDFSDFFTTATLRGEVQHKLNVLQNNLNINSEEDREYVKDTLDGIKTSLTRYNKELAKFGLKSSPEASTSMDILLENFNGELKNMGTLNEKVLSTAIDSIKDMFNKFFKMVGFDNWKLTTTQNKHNAKMEDHKEQFRDITKELGNQFDNSISGIAGDESSVVDSTNKDVASDNAEAAGVQAGDAAGPTVDGSGGGDGRSKGGDGQADSDGDGGFHGI